MVGRPHEQMDAQTEERGRERAGWYTREETTKLAGRAAGQNDARHPPGVWVRVVFGAALNSSVEGDPCTLAQSSQTLPAHLWRDRYKPRYTPPHCQAVPFGTIDLVDPSAGWYCRVPGDQWQRAYGSPDSWSFRRLRLPVSVILHSGLADIRTNSEISIR
jgi:hypothetical protein